MVKKHSDFTPVTGGARLPKSRLRDDVDNLCNLVADSDLDRHIVRLLAIHPQLRIRFRNQDLSQLDDDTKRALLDDMNDLLGIRPAGVGKK